MPERSSSRRQEIIDAARVTLREKGFEATRMDDIAGQVGIARPNLYRYFSNKEDLVRALLDAEISAVNNQRRYRIPLSGNVRDLLIESLSMGADLAASNELLSVVLTDDLGAISAKLIAADETIMAREADYWRPILRYGRQRDELNSSISDNRILSWFMANHYVFLARPELVIGDRREWIADFVVAPVLNQSHHDDRQRPS
ncbi:TetR/AcrR family transcriptional regulator [Rhodococcus koreensis]|uniref:TetR/AcrR family transcriptional regulator n=1 Tax=Rhodococcus koreensis TaxID=99653 RepID=UPI00366BA9A4